MDQVLQFLPIIIIIAIVVIIAKKKSKATHKINPNAVNAGYQDMGSHVLLLIFTFGVWYLIWIHKTTKFLNSVPSHEHRDPTKKLLLCIFVPFYIIYWTYKSALLIDKLAISKGQHSDMSILCTILAIFIGIVPPIIMQNKINELVSTKLIRKRQPSPTRTHITTVNAADEIKKYKELYDIGAITEEEFNAKKKKLLNL